LGHVEKFASTNITLLWTKPVSKVLGVSDHYDINSQSFLINTDLYNWDDREEIGRVVGENG
jgi:hypothetical protein